MIKLNRDICTILNYISFNTIYINKSLTYCKRPKIDPYKRNILNLVTVTTTNNKYYITSGKERWIHVVSISDIKNMTSFIVRSSRCIRIPVTTSLRPVKNRCVLVVQPG